jgi:Uma2 family endonuclease
MNAFAKVDKATFLKFAADHQGQRYDDVQGRIVQQPQGGTRRHGRLADRLLAAIEAQLDVSQWVVIRERGVETPDTIRYGDVVVEPVSEPDDSLVTVRAALVIEVLSPSSIAHDLEFKPAECGAMPSLLAYVVVSQTERAGRIWQRDRQGHFPADASTVEGTGARIEVPALGLSLALDDIYDGII